MSVELQNIDCNCNNCAYMIRDSEKFKISLERHYKWQLDYHNVIKQKLVDKAIFWRDKKGDLEKWDNLLRESENMKFQFDKKEATINYGNCSKFNHKEISFIPNTTQLDTQECFENRKQINQTKKED